jgi:hypothetical protein
MKVIIPENRLEQFIFKYLDVRFKDLEQAKGRFVEIVFKFPGEQAGIMGWSKNDDSNRTLLSIYHKIIDDIFSLIPIEKREIVNMIGRYIENRYNLIVNDAEVYPYRHQMVVDWE